MIPSTRLEQYDVELVYVTTRQQWRSVWKRHGLPKDRPAAAGRTDTILHAKDGALGVVVVWLDPKHRLNQTPAGVVNTITHEAWHAATEVLDAICEPRQHWHEQAAYLTAWIAQWLWTNTPEEIR